MKILVTGRYETDYNRNLVVLKGLETCGVQVVRFPYKKKDKATARELRIQSKVVDLVFLPSFTHMDVGFVKRNVSVPVFFDPLVSRYMTKALDYKKVHPWSIRGLKNYLKDWISMRKADHVFADTPQHMEYYHKKFDVPYNKMSVLPVGVDCSLFSRESKKNEGIIIVGFYGSFIPLHGIPVIVEAARLLRDRKEIKFRIIGDGFTMSEVRKMMDYDNPGNIEFIGKVEYHELPGYIRNFDIALGIFGNTLKATLVVPNKVYHYAGCGIPTVTMDSPAMRSFFTQDEIVMIKSEPEELARAITELSENPEKRRMLSMAIHKKAITRYDCSHIGEAFIAASRRILS